MKGSYKLNIIDVLEIEEGFREKAYLCSEGYATIGIGTKIHTDEGVDPSKFCFTVTRQIAGLMLDQELERLYEKLDSQMRGLSEDRKTVLVSMAYQMGITGLFGFKNMWRALDTGNFAEAERQALDSKWAKQTPARAMRHAAVLGGRSLEDVYTGLHSGG
jgi:lysozyme